MRPPKREEPGSKASGCMTPFLGHLDEAKPPGHKANQWSPGRRGSTPRGTGEFLGAKTALYHNCAGGYNTVHICKRIVQQ